MKAQIRGLVPTKMFPKITSLHTFVLAVLFLTTALTGRASPVSFRSEIAPLLLAQCQGCHGAEKAKGDYRVDSYTELMRALEEEPPRVQAGKPAASLILQLLSSEEADDRMPQKSAPLGAGQIGEREGKEGEEKKGGEEKEGGEGREKRGWRGGTEGGKVEGSMETRCGGETQGAVKMECVILK